VTNEPVANLSIAALRKHAESLPGATVDIKWGADRVASVGGRMFFVTAEGPSPSAASFKVDDHRFLELTDMPGFVPAPYLARAKWVQLTDAKALPLAELKALVSRSHALVLAKCPKRLQKELAG
jgi:predicted DNA-binding protein (MmcQ/YjbR family)